MVARDWLLWAKTLINSFHGNGCYGQMQFTIEMVSMALRSNGSKEKEVWLLRTKTFPWQWLL